MSFEDGVCIWVFVKFFRVRGLELEFRFIGLEGFVF